MQNARKHPIANFASRFVLVASRSFVILKHTLSLMGATTEKYIYRLIYNNIGGVFRLGRSAALFHGDAVQATYRVCFIPTSTAPRSGLASHPRQHGA